MYIKVRTDHGKKVHLALEHSEGHTLLCEPRQGWAHKLVGAWPEAVTCKECLAKIGGRRLEPVKGYGGRYHLALG